MEKNFHFIWGNLFLTSCANLIISHHPLELSLDISQPKLSDFRISADARRPEAKAYNSYVELSAT